MKGFYLFLVLAIIAVLLIGAGCAAEEEAPPEEEEAAELLSIGVKVGDKWTISGECRSSQPVDGETEFIQTIKYEVIEITADGFVTIKQTWSEPLRLDTLG